MAARIPRKTYWKVWLVLEVLVGASYGLARISMGPGDVILPLLIAATQMLLVMLYFMHVRFSEHLIWVIIAVGFFFLYIMVDLTLSDYLTRGSAWPLP